MTVQVFYDEILEMEVPIEADTEEAAREILAGYIGWYQAHADYIKLLRVEVKQD